MEIRAFFVLVVPFIILFYMAALLFLRAPRTVLLPSLLGGLVMSLLNILVDMAAYYAHWWHYTLNGLILHVPLPFYISDLLIYGSFAYLLIWRFWKSRLHWFSLLLLIGVPAFCILRDVSGALAKTSYTVWDSWLAAPLTVVMWVVAFYLGYWIFKRLSPSYEVAAEIQARDDARRFPQLQRADHQEEEEEEYAEADEEHEDAPLR
ncbi:hypothetical protein EPA93_29895 [Ktedonosporobacter rubrisoli]|uniref:Uncharacterized protein n=1 Tax=Ktedonosporobacter rubrisoli TaxID=2509675 RepID=A0A4P6JWB4_KTERU|nr:hypothetical protein [Ktedonosporobacter rubrisoli]QBD79969.1 hypothetical protein EPA93_29895 [Ktedonosporobacter rubrisoli]